MRGYYFLPFRFGALTHLCAALPLAVRRPSTTFISHSPFPLCGLSSRIWTPDFLRSRCVALSPRLCTSSLRLLGVPASYTERDFWVSFKRQLLWVLVARCYTTRHLSIYPLRSFSAVHAVQPPSWLPPCCTRLHTGCPTSLRYGLYGSALHLLRFCCLLFTLTRMVISATLLPRVVVFQLALPCTPIHRAVDSGLPHPRWPFAFPPRFRVASFHASQPFLHFSLHLVPPSRAPLAFPRSVLFFSLCYLTLFLRPGVKFVMLLSFRCYF